MSLKHFSLSPVQKSLLFEHGIRRLTFLVAQKVGALSESVVPGASLHVPACQLLSMYQLNHRVINLIKKIY